MVNQTVDNHDKSIGLKFIPNQSDLFRFISKSVSELIRLSPSQSEPPNSN